MGLSGAFKNVAIVTELIYGPAFTAPPRFRSPRGAEVTLPYNPRFLTGPTAGQRRGTLSRHRLLSLPTPGAWTKLGPQTWVCGGPHSWEVFVHRAPLCPAAG